ncbi:hypothetical protein BJY52DRAFT_446856 [Lactarius psammicola]|nr:hypothetical protein BJY52DRAFT_446856 [Lactarius psammicola]
MWTPWGLQLALDLTTAQMYKAWACRTTNGAEPLTDELPEGAKPHGGPVLPLWRVQYMLPVRECQSAPDSTEGTQASPCLTKVRLQTTLIPVDRAHQLSYPNIPSQSKVRQTLAAVQHLLDAGTRPSKLILAGDSAGGNLALQIVGQHLHPHPSLPAPPRDPYVWAGCYCYRAGWNSVLTRRRTRAVPCGMCCPCARTSYSLPARCREWRRSYTRIWSRHSLMVAGEHEGLLDSIEAAARAVAEETQVTTVFILPGGVHDDLILTFGAGEVERERITG